MAESPKMASKLINAQTSGMINNALMVTTPNEKSSPTAGGGGGGAQPKESNDK